MSDQSNKISRHILPIPDRHHIGLTTYDAKDPDTKFPPIEPLRPSEGGAECVDRAPRRRWICGIERVRGCHQHANGRAARRQWPQVQSLPYDSALLADAQAMLTGRNHHSVNMGAICELATSAPGYSSVLPKNRRRSR